MSHLGHLGQARSYLAIREAVICFSAFVVFLSWVNYQTYMGSIGKESKKMGR